MGSDPFLITTIYKSLVRSRIEYGSFIWSNVPAHLFKKLDATQNKAIRLALNYRTSTPLNILIDEFKLPPLDIRFKFLCHDYISKTLTREGHLLLPVLKSLQNKNNDPPLTFANFNLPPYANLLLKVLMIFPSSLYFTMAGNMFGSCQYSSFLSSNFIHRRFFAQ